MYSELNDQVQTAIIEKRIQRASRPQPPQRPRHTVQARSQRDCYLRARAWPEPARLSPDSRGGLNHVCQTCGLVGSGV